MLTLPPNDFVEARDGNIRLAGTRIGLAVFVAAYRNGKTPEAILEAYPSIGSLEKVHGTIAFIEQHAQFIQDYLDEQDALWDQFKREHPMPEALLERLRRTRERLSRRSA